MEQQFSLAALIRSHVAETWTGYRSHEKTVCAQLAEQHGAPRANYLRIPADALRDLTVGDSASSGYLAGSELGGYLDALQPVSVALRLGATIDRAEGGSHIVPVGASPASATWLADEAAQVAQGEPNFGQTVATPKLLGAYALVSRQLLLQSTAEQVVRRELRNAAAAALDAAVLGGSGGSGEPQGVIVSASATFPGAGLDQAALRDGQNAVAATLAPDSVVGLVTTPSVSKILSSRQRFTGSSNTLWEGASHHGRCEGMDSYTTQGMPTATAIIGAFQHIVIIEWAMGVEVLVDGFTHFKSGLVAVRLLLPVDVVVARPSAFSAANSIT